MDHPIAGTAMLAQGSRRHCEVVHWRHHIRTFRDGHHKCGDRWLEAPAIVQNFLATERDWQILRAGIRMVEEVANQGALRPFVGKKLAPLARTDADLSAYIMQTGITVHHPLGTSKMGVPTDDLAVVDGNLNVFGTKQLRVVDASVMPISSAATSTRR